jgi:response regulator RpfG family c-di-GMP phosphodiesterase
MHEKILLVDDEPAILQGYQRVLHREFQIDIALGSAQALSKIAADSYAVVVSDMRMPEMDGVQLLARIKVQSPETIRVILTGNADIETAIDAVNEGNIFRFLTKPCSKETLARTLTAGLVQYRLVTAEKELLEQTLRGSIQVLTDVLGLVNPAAFSRAVRIRKYVRHVVAAMNLSNPWMFEVAAMMSQLGCVTLHPETVDAVYAGKAISPDEQTRFNTHPRIGGDLLANIPRMEPIAWMISHQSENTAAAAHQATEEIPRAIRQGADILRAALRFDEQFQRGVGKAAVLKDLRSRWSGMDAAIFEALSEVEAETGQKVVQTCTFDALSIGMTFNEEVRTERGLLIVAKGQEVTFPLIVKLKNFLEKREIFGKVSVTAPKPGVNAVAMAARL